VFDDDQRVAHGQQRVEAVQQLDNIGEVQAGGGLVQEKQRAVASGGGHVSGQFQALGFAGRQRGGGLAQSQVVQAHVDQLFQLGLHLHLAAEKGKRFADRHFQDFGDIAAAIGD